MLSPKMQRSVRVNENQLIMLSDRAQYDHSMHGHLHKRTSDNNKWQMRWFVLYQNLLFYYESEQSSRPSGLIFLEGCYCERLVSAPSISGPPISTSTGQAPKIIKEEKLQHCFTICYRRENQRQYELRAATESECSAWIIAIREASFNKLLLQKEELEQKHVHLLQVVESEKTAKWQYTQQCEELASEIRKLRAEVSVCVCVFGGGGWGLKGRIVCVRVCIPWDEGTVQKVINRPQFLLAFRFTTLQRHRPEAFPEAFSGFCEVRWLCRLKGMRGGQRVGSFEAYRERVIAFAMRWRSNTLKN
uniref:PH domain-containing protein n=1 Tax=Anopheles culicifacies TaxID=139723 RepID=A0A182MAZ2_9DIPT